MWEGGILKKANSTACRTFSWLLCCYTKVVHCAPPSQTAAAAQSCILCFIPLRPLRPQLRKNLDDEGREREEGEPFHCCLVAAQTRPRVRDRRAGCVITLICLREENAFILETKNSRDPTTSKIFNVKKQAVTVAMFCSFHVTVVQQCNRPSISSLNMFSWISRLTLA